MRALPNSYFLKEDGLFFSFPIQGSGLSLFSNLSMGEFCPLRIPLDKLGAAVSPTDKLRKNSALPPVTSEKSTLFIGVTKTRSVESPKGDPAEREFHRVNKVLQSSRDIILYFSKLSSDSEPKAVKLLRREIRDEERRRLAKERRLLGCKKEGKNLLISI